MREELPELPQTLEPPPMSKSRKVSHSAETTQHENELATLENMRNRILLQLMREEIRLKRILEAGPQAASASEDVVLSDPQPPRSVKEGE